MLGGRRYLGGGGGVFEGVGSGRGIGVTIRRGYRSRLNSVIFTSDTISDTIHSGKAEIGW